MVFIWSPLAATVWSTVRSTVRSAFPLLSPFPVRRQFQLPSSANLPALSCRFYFPLLSSYWLVYCLIYCLIYCLVPATCFPRTSHEPVATYHAWEVCRPYSAGCSHKSRRVSTYFKAASSMPGMLSQGCESPALCALLRERAPHAPPAPRAGRGSADRSASAVRSPPPDQSAAPAAPCFFVDAAYRGSRLNAAVPRTARLYRRTADYGSV